MRPRCDLAIGVLLAGCNTVFELGSTGLVDAAVEVDAAPELPDRDRDGIPDPQDPCIQSIWDREGDWDGDADSNQIDVCPFDYGLVDGDGDTIGDECDPFSARAGDRRYCLMTFVNPTINRALWTVREGSPDAFDLLQYITSRGDGTLVAQESFEAPTTTSYDLVLFFSDPIAPATEAAVTFWLRRGDSASPGDVGCEVRGDGASSTLTIRGTSPPTALAIAQPLARMYKLDATVIAAAPPGRNNVRCTGVYSTATGVQLFQVAGEAVLSPGHVAFQVEATKGAFEGLSIMARDDQPGL